MHSDSIGRPGYSNFIGMNEMDFERTFSYPAPVPEVFAQAVASYVPPTATPLIPFAAPVGQAPFVAQPVAQPVMAQPGMQMMPMQPGMAVAQPMAQPVGQAVAVPVAQY